MTHTHILHHPATQAAKDFSFEANLSIFLLLENSELKFNIQRKVVKGRFFCEVFSFLSDIASAGFGLEAETKAKFNHLIEKVFSINFSHSHSLGRVQDLSLQSAQLFD